MSERIYEKPKLHRLDGRYHSAQGICETGAAQTCATGGGFGSQTTQNCTVGDYASTACTTGYRQGWRLCNSGQKAATACVNGPANKCATGGWVGQATL